MGKVRVALARLQANPWSYFARTPCEKLALYEGPTSFFLSKRVFKKSQIGMGAALQTQNGSRGWAPFKNRS